MQMHNFMMEYDMVIVITFSLGGVFTLIVFAHSQVWVAVYLYKGKGGGG